MSNLFAGLETCFPNLTGNGKMNVSNFPVGSAQHLSLNYNILPFLCDLLKVATDETVSPILTDPPKPFDLTPYTDFSGLNNVGDTRVSLGETLTQTYIHFLPRVIVQTEVRQSGGSQVIDNYICTADGTPIKESNLIPAVLSLDLTGEKPYQYGAITVPPVSASYEDLMKIIDPQEVKDYVSQYVKISRARHANEFANFVKEYLGDWEIVSLNVYKNLQIMLLVLKKADDMIYLKYYADVSNEVGCFLGLENYNLYLQYQAPTSMAQSNAIGSTIPNYKLLMETPEKAQEFYITVINNYKTNPDLQWDNLFTSTNSALAIQEFNTYAAAVSSVPEISSVNVFQCDNIT